MVRGMQRARLRVASGQSHGRGGARMGWRILGRTSSRLVSKRAGGRLLATTLLLAAISTACIAEPESAVTADALLPDGLEFGLVQVDNLPVYRRPDLGSTRLDVNSIGEPLFPRGTILRFRYEPDGWASYYPETGAEGLDIYTEFRAGTLYAGDLYFRIEDLRVLRPEDVAPLSVHDDTNATDKWLQIDIAPHCATGIDACWIRACEGDREVLYTEIIINPETTREAITYYDRVGIGHAAIRRKRIAKFMGGGEGANSSYYVPWVMYVQTQDGYALHGSPWRGDWSRGFVNQNDTHGCINIPHRDSRRIFSDPLDADGTQRHGPVFRYDEAVPDEDRLGPDWFLFRWTTPIQDFYSETTAAADEPSALVRQRVHVAEDVGTAVEFITTDGPVAACQRGAGR